MGWPQMVMVMMGERGYCAFSPITIVEAPYSPRGPC